jgi:hypothetical protein
MTMPRHYAVFGGVLASAFEFPELRAAAAAPADWSLIAADDAPDSPLGEHLGSHAVTPHCTVRLHRTADGLALVYDDTGRFDLPASGDAVFWRRGPQPDEAAMRIDVLGRCLALALHQRGAFALHASSVVLPAGAIALVAPSGTGKSSLALALVRHGARLLTDDTLPIDPGSPPIARPGVQSVRLREDSAAVLAASERCAGEAWGKREYRDLPAAALAGAPAPLRAIYLLTRGDATQAVAAETTELPGVVAASALVSQHKLGALLGGSEAGPTLQRAAALVRAVPVRVLRVARDLSRLPEAAALIAGWHGG